VGGGSRATDSTGELFVGIDLAIAKHKRLPVAVCEADCGAMHFLSLRKDFVAPPSGIGNAAALNKARRAEFVAAIVAWLAEVETAQKRSIGCVAIDAPSSPCHENRQRRLAEIDLGRSGLSCFATPTRAQCESVVSEAKKHLEAGGSEARIPHANKIWMLVGFDLFEAISARWQCIEVYPQAIVHWIGANAEHKSKATGFAAQCTAFARAIGMSEEALKLNLHAACYGARHDCLDAMMSAWIASLPASDRKAYGNGTDDAIWVPGERFKVQSMLAVMP